MAAPLVSVVAAACNHERHVAAALDSVAAQTHPAIELIVVDDGSTDATADIAARWLASPAARRFDRVELVRNERNLGAAASLNRGMALARGEYLSLLGSDDRYAPGRLATLLGRLAREDSRFAFSAVMPVDDAGQPALEAPLARRIATAREEFAVLPSASFGFLYRQLAISTGNFLLHRSLREEVGEFASLRHCYDWDYALRAFLHAEPVFVDEYLYFYRVRAADSSALEEGTPRREAEAVLTGHFERCLAGVVPNDRAPTPRNWPGVFEHYVRFYGLEHLWHPVRRRHGAPDRYPPAMPDRPRLALYAPTDVDDADASIGTVLRQTAHSLRRARAKGWGNLPRAVVNAMRLWLRAGS
jgi:glycosyltransferase involved in cell wall biosynthesis